MGGLVPSVWKAELKRFIRSANDLADHGILSHEDAERLSPILNQYRLAISPYYAGLMEKGNIHCPIFLQSVPLETESSPSSGFSRDPLEDTRYQVAPRLTYRLKGRALLHVTPLCSMYCRFCFRKTLLNDAVEELFSGDLEEAYSFLRNNAEIEEIILTGGDPLMLGDESIAQILRRLHATPSIRRLRIHSRVPVTFPSRIDDSLCASIGLSFGRKVLVTHFNHPKELTSASIQSCRKLETAGFSIWNQSVLLRGVNDDPSTLVALLRDLVAAEIRPYYLHHPDRAEGTNQFYLSLEDGLRLYRRAQRKWPGGPWPRYVVDRLGPEGKIDVSLAVRNDQTGRTGS